MAAICSEFEWLGIWYSNWCLDTGPFDVQPPFDHLNTGHILESHITWLPVLPDSAICSKIGYFLEALATFVALASLKFGYYWGYFKKIR